MSKPKIAVQDQEVETVFFEGDLPADVQREGSRKYEDIHVWQQNVIHIRADLSQVMLVRAGNETSIGFYNALWPGIEETMQNRERQDAALAIDEKAKHTAAHTGAKKNEGGKGEAKK